MKIGKKLMMIVSSLLILTLGGCTKSATTEVNVLATTDLHGQVPYAIAEYVKQEREMDESVTLVDAGDFHDGDGYGPMDKYISEKRENYEKGIEKYIEYPLAKDMGQVGYDCVVLGNHEFVGNVRSSLDNMVSDFEKNNIDVLSANTYKDNDENYVKPYTIKEINTDDGVVKLGVLGLTIKEVGESKDFDENGNMIEAKSRELKDQYGYDGKLYMNDLVDEANKWSKIMKEEEQLDIIVAVVHSGEKPKKPKNPGNRIQEIAQESEYIDAIVAGHTHKKFEQHDYKNKNNEKVIVTQPGNHGESISKITFELDKEKESWKIVNKRSKLTEFEKDKSEDNGYELMFNIADIKEGTTEVKLKGLTPFEWDKAYVFKGNTPVEKVYETVGYKWRSIVEVTDESIVQTVFMKDDKVVCFLTIDPGMMGISMSFEQSLYKDGVIELYPDENDKFSVKKGKEVFETDLTYIGK